MVKLSLPWAWTPNIGVMNSINLVVDSNDIITMYFFYPRDASQQKC